MKGELERGIKRRGSGEVGKGVCRGGVSVNRVTGSYGMERIRELKREREERGQCCRGGH